MLNKPNKLKPMANQAQELEAKYLAPYNMAQMASQSSQLRDQPRRTSPRINKT